MDIKQKTTFTSVEEGREITTIMDSDTPVTAAFSHYMKGKGWCIDRMIQSHKEEEAEAERQLGTKDIEAEAEVPEVEVLTEAV